MAGISRRNFLEAGGASAALAFMAANGVKLKANPLGLPIGSQTYPHRARIRRGRVHGAAQGHEVDRHRRRRAVRSVELQGVRPLQDAQDDAGRCWTMPASRRSAVTSAMGIYRKQHKDVLNWATAVGLTQLSTADLGGTTKDGNSRLSNGITTPCVDQGSGRRVQRDRRRDRRRRASCTVLHNEGFCNSRTADGRLTYPLLIEALDPALVGMQFQMSSMTSMGNPITYFTVYPGRFWSAHMQGVDASQGVRGAAPQTLPDKNAPPPGRRWRRRCACRSRAPAAGAPAARRRCAGGPAMGGGAAGGGGRGGLSVGEDTRELAGGVHRGEGRRHEELLHRAGWELTVKSAAYPEDADRHVASKSRGMDMAGISRRNFSGGGRCDRARSPSWPPTASR